MHYDNTMRPQILFPLYTPTQSLPGIGPRAKKIIAELAGETLISLCWRLPTGFINRSRRVKIADAEPGTLATLEVEVGAHKTPRPFGRQPYRVSCHDETGEMELVFFRAHADYLRRVLPPGKTRFISGTIQAYQERRQMAHPDYILTRQEYDEMPAFEPVYRVTAGITSRHYAKIARGALKSLPDLPEWLSADWMNEKKWPPWKEAVLKAHEPQDEEDLSPSSPARERLAYDEYLASQLALILTRQWMRRLPGRIFPKAAALREKAMSALPFALTSAQEAAIAEIDGDMGQPMRMLRLLQGDVGSGKTIVAFLAMLNAVEAGAQAAIMAPTEILARQHFKTLLPLCQKIGAPLTLLTARQSAAEKRRVLTDIQTGMARLIAGTHSLFQKHVAFRDLGLCVIDEQHRFGVHQRLTLSGKGRKSVDMLVMTATPIPRTLALAHYGDMDMSALREKPPGRRPVATRALPLERLDDVVEAVRRAASQGRRIYWICPLVGEEGEEGADAALALTAASDRHRHLSAILDCGAGLVHGRMAGDEKDRTLTAFQQGKIQLLVATSVIEVGVDVAEATVMVIEDAQRFGLAQLHQMRGRVGRGEKDSACLLLYRAPLGETARARLDIMRETEDGFRIAEEDLRLRGGGEILGTKQSGAVSFLLGDPAAQSDLFARAHDEAARILQEDPQLKSERGEALRLLLYLFGRDEAARTLRSG